MWCENSLPTSDLEGHILVLNQISLLFRCLSFQTAWKWHIEDWDGSEKLFTLKNWEKHSIRQTLSSLWWSCAWQIDRSLSFDGFFQSQVPKDIQSNCTTIFIAWQYKYYQDGCQHLRKWGLSFKDRDSTWESKRNVSVCCYLGNICTGNSFFLSICGHNSSLGLAGLTKYMLSFYSRKYFNFKHWWINIVGTSI